MKINAWFEMDSDNDGESGLITYLVFLAIAAIAAIWIALDYVAGH